MKTKHLLATLLIGGATFAFSQTTVTSTVNTSLDDHEERINGSVPQSGTVGDMDSGSSDLELGNESATADPQLVGVRFASLAIPANANITNAYIQFAVDATSKNTDPCVLTVQVEDNVNAATFSDNAFSLSSRSLIATSVTWSVSGATWSIVGSQGVDQRTADIKSLVQTIVNKAGWVSGNAMAFYIKGTGTREVEAFDGDPALAPKLVVEYSIATGINETHSTGAFVNVYPNPFHGNLNIQVSLQKTEDLSVSIYDLTGKVMESKHMGLTAAGILNYTPASTLAAGMYFVKIQTGTQQQTIKVISE